MANNYEYEDEQESAVAILAQMMIYDFNVPSSQHFIAINFDCCYVNFSACKITILCAN